MHSFLMPPLPGSTSTSLETRSLLDLKIEKVSHPAATEAASPFPILTLGLITDLGQQTRVANSSVHALLAMAPDAILQVGGLGYGTGDFSPRWDAYGRMLEPLTSRYPLLHVPGGQEYYNGQVVILNKRVLFYTNLQYTCINCSLRTICFPGHTRVRAPMASRGGCCHEQ